jgi:hypothetical protein
VSKRQQAEFLRKIFTLLQTQACKPASNRMK